MAWQRRPGSGVPALALVTLVGLLTACGDGGGPAASTPRASTATSASPQTSPGDSANAAPDTWPSASPTVTGTSAAGRTAYVFPVAGSGVHFGRAHHDYPATDIFAPCGNQVRSPVTGTLGDVSPKDVWSAARNGGATRGGLSVAVVGDDGVRYYGSHLSSLAAGIRPGRRVAAGQPLGRVGNSGDARGIACHVHFGISPPCRAGDWWVRRGVVSPYRYLTAWRAGRQLSPASEVTAWRRSRGCPTSPHGMPDT